MGTTRIVSREEWAGALTDGGEPLKASVKYVVLTYETPTFMCYNHDECVTAVKRLYKYYVIDRGMRDIPFNFLVGHDGTVYEARGWKCQPSRSLRQFAQTHGNRLDIAFIGDYTTEYYPYQMSLAFLTLMDIGIAEGYIDRFYEPLEYRDRDRVRAAAAEEKFNKPWENWQIQRMAKKIFRKDLDYDEANERLKYLIPEENKATNNYCVIM